MSIFESSTFLWAIAIVAGVALAIVVLTEIIDRLRRNNHPLTSVVEMARNIVLLLMALVLLQRLVIGMPLFSTPVRLVSTALWIFVIIVIVRLAGVLFREGDQPTWHDGIPRLFKRMPVYAAVILILWYLLQRVWSLPLSEYAAALGIGSLAVAFALQDTLSNLVSGLFILFNRPFSEGEWIHIGDTEGRVLTINWRYTSIETRNGDVIVFPNGSISNASITNHSQPTPRTRVVESIVVAYVNPPNKVKRMLMETMQETPGILADPAPVIAVTTIDDPLMGYEIRYWVDDYADKPAIHNAFMTRIWYAARRHDVALPSPAFDLYHYDGPTVNKEGEVTPAKLVAMLRSVETFSWLPINVVEELCSDAELQEYAVSEEIIGVGDTERGISVIIDGTAQLNSLGADGLPHSIDQLSEGAIFGETGLFGRPISPYTVTACADVTVVRLKYDAVTDVINRNPEFARNVNAFIRRRRESVERVLDGNGPSTAPVSQSNGHPAAIQGNVS